MKIKNFDLLLALALLPFIGYSQNTDVSKKETNTKIETTEIPIDPNMKIGKLSNSLTYDIRNNRKPEDKIKLRIVINADTIR